MLPVLKSNEYTLSNDGSRLGYLKSTPAHTPVQELKTIFDAQGYIWLKGLLDKEQVLDFRKKYFTSLKDTGIIKENTPIELGIFSGAIENKTLANQKIAELVLWKEYEAFCKSEKLVQLFENYFGGSVYLHKRKLIRHTLPGDKNATGAHYDLTYLRAGTDKLITAWIPIGEVSIEMGGLMYLEGTHSWGKEMEKEFSKKNKTLSAKERINAFNKNMGEVGWLTKDLPSLAEKLNTRWLCANYEAGDVVLHSPYMIHASTMNQDTQGRMRLSTDIRYQLAEDEIDMRWSKDWNPNDNL
jgi:ectoine hydroxylase-related dioxygenase (phytanoyl-CoA dioxygenase family)